MRQLLLTSLCLGACLTLQSILPVHADGSGGFDPGLIPGTLFSAGRTDTTRSGGLGSGYFLDTNYTRSFVNAGVDYKNMGTESTGNVCAGISIANILQLQAGYGSKGAVQRLRHDFNMTQVYDFLTDNHRSPYNMTIENRITFTFAIERYNQHQELDNASIGLGLLF